MFKKKPTIKSLSPLRSSDRRKLADQIIADLQLPVPDKPPDDASAEDKAAAAAALTDLRNALLPESAMAARFSTTVGAEARTVGGSVYAAALAPGGEVRVLWVKVDERMYPTVYSLWHNPGLLPLLLTPELVVAKLRGGADLMTPGLANGPPFPRGARKGAVVAVASLERPSVPLVVGVCEVDVAALESVVGAKGHAVRTVTWYGDELWAWGAGGRKGAEPPDAIEGWGGDGVEGAVAGVQQMDLGEGAGDSQAEEAAETVSDDEEEDDEAEKRTWSTADIDEAFRSAFLYGITQFMESGSPPHYGMDFPIKQSFVMSSLVQPFLPSFTKSDSEALQMKKTSWKTIKKFIKALNKEKLVLIKEWGSEAAILDVDFAHRSLVGFQRYPIPAKSERAGDGPPQRSGGDVPDTDPSIGQRLRVVTSYKIPEKLRPLLDPGADTAGFRSAAALRDIVSGYVEREELAKADNRRLVALDPFIANTLVTGAREGDAAALAKGAIPRDALLDRVLAACSPFHAIVRDPAPGGPDAAAASATATAATPKPKAGAAPKITITLETRGGNKTTTRVAGLAAYHVPAAPLAEELRRACAGSAGLERAVGAPGGDKAPRTDVVVQGPQKEAVVAALARRGVEARWVEVVDKTKKKKR